MVDSPEGISFRNTSNRVAHLWTPDAAMRIDHLLFSTTDRGTPRVTLDGSI
jgi:hypothetical protein